ncbi:hypothetical protein KGD90_23085 [Rhodococcus qingshengii]|nr:hypothetical protein [Rhodococcus qingshengii]
MFPVPAFGGLSEGVVVDGGGGYSASVDDLGGCAVQSSGPADYFGCGVAFVLSAGRRASRYFSWERCVTPIVGSFDPVFTPPVDTPASDGCPVLILRTFESAWSVYGILADTHGHVPVRDRYDRLWILVEVAGRLRSRRTFIHDHPDIGDSPDVYGLIDVDSRAILHARDLIEAHGPLRVDPSPAAVLAPLRTDTTDAANLPTCTSQASFDVTRLDCPT